MEAHQDYPKILLVDDDKNDRKYARNALSDQEYCIYEAINGQRAHEILHDYSVDLILLDLKLPGESGLNLISTIRRHSDVPIIIVSGLKSSAEKQEGLNKGADDYISKPFFPEELRARINANLRRYLKQTSYNLLPIYIYFSGWTFDQKSFDLFDSCGRNAGLTLHEYQILEKLIKAEGRTLTRLDLADQPSRRGIDVQITRLRKKLGDAGSCIKTIRGIGYRFDDPTLAINRKE